MFVQRRGIDVDHGRGRGDSVVKRERRRQVEGEGGARGGESAALVERLAAAVDQGRASAGGGEEEGHGRQLSSSLARWMTEREKGIQQQPGPPAHPSTARPQSPPVRPSAGPGPAPVPRVPLSNEPSKGQSYAPLNTSVWCRITGTLDDCDGMVSSVVCAFAEATVGEKGEAAGGHGRWGREKGCSRLLGVVGWTSGAVGIGCVACGDAPAWAGRGDSQRAP